jgi:excisionase family DNA binding protein
MFKTPYYISSHAVEQFKERVCNALSTIVIRKLIMYFLSTTEPVKYQKFNHEDQPVYRGEFDGREFIIPVIKDVKKHNNTWKVVPTILLPGMSQGYRKEFKEIKSPQYYMTAQELSREIKVHRTTIMDMVKKGKIKTLKHDKGERYRIPADEASRVIKNHVRPYEKWYRNWSETEIYIMVNNKNRSSKYIAELLKRNINSVKIEKSRLRKKGYDV